MRLIPASPGDRRPDLAEFDDAPVVFDPGLSLPAGSVTLGHRQLSPDGRYLAWSYDPDGAEHFTHLVRDLRTGADRILTTGGVHDAAWSPDSESLLVALVDPQHRPARLVRYPVDGAPPQTVWHEPDPHVAVRARLSRDGRCNLLVLSSRESAEVRRLTASLDEVLMGREEGLRLEPDFVTRADGSHHLMAVRSTPTGLQVFDLGSQTRLNTESLGVPLQVPPGHRLRQVRCFAAGDVALSETDGGMSVLVRCASASAFTAAGHFPAQTVLFASPDHPDTDLVTLQVTGLAIPPRTLTLDLRTATIAPLPQQVELLADHTSPPLRVHTIHATADDGTRIPVTVLTRADDALTEPAPMLLQVYGAYGVSMPRVFDPARIPLLRRGIRVAFAHVRGGGDGGPHWHRQGMGAGKLTTVGDLLACVRHLRTSGMTHPLVASGASAGGTMVAAALNRSPELFDGALLTMPFVDPLSAMQDPDAPFTVRDRAEWGDPLSSPDDAAALAALSPLQNLAPLPYPRLRVISSDTDVRAPGAAVHRWFHRLQDLAICAAERQLVTLKTGGHDATIRDHDHQVDDLAWLIEVLLPGDHEGDSR